MTPQNTILIVDDENRLRLSLSLILQKENYRVETAANAEEVLDCLQSHEYDLMFLDLNLPGMSGEEFALHLQGEPNFARVPVFALSGRALEGKAAAIFAGTLLKPVNLDSLVSQLKRALLSNAGPDIS